MNLYGMNANMTKHLNVRDKINRGGEIMVKTITFSNKFSLDRYNDLLSVTDLATIFDTTENTIYNEIKRGKFGAPIKIGRKYKVSKAFVFEKFFKG